MSISDEVVEAALVAALPTIYENLSLPYGASVNDYPNLDDLRAADEECERKNMAILRDIIRAALEAAAPYLAAATLRDAADALAEAASWSTSKPGPEQIQRWLKSRAAAVERPTP